MSLFQLLYVSSLVANESEALPEIMDVSMRNNKLRNITGMLLYAEGNILQVLEGETDTVLKTFGHIQMDSRHRGVFPLLERGVDARYFSSWSMGYRKLPPALLQRLPKSACLFVASPEEIAARVRPSEALQVLQSFAQDSMGLV